MKFKELVDIEYLTRLFEKFSSITNLAIGLLEYPSQEIVVASGWVDICTKFHRECLESSKACIESNIYLTSRLKDTNDIGIKHCSNGLVDGCAPIIVDGDVIATIFLGQVFFEKPDINFFKTQANKFGFEEKAYLEALSMVPVISEEKFVSVLKYFSQFAVILAEVSVLKKNLIEKYEHLKKNQQEYLKLQQWLSEAMQESSVAVIIVDENVTPIYMNELVPKILGQSKESLMKISYDNPQLDFKIFTLDGKELSFVDFPIVKAVKEKIELNNFEYIIKRKDGSESWILVNGTPIFDKQKNFIQAVSLFLDITESKLLEKDLLEERLKLESNVKGKTEELQKSLERLGNLINIDKSF